MDAELISLLREWFGPQGIIALGVVFTGIQSWRNGRAAKHTKETIAKVIEQTNGMSHRLETLAVQVGVAEGREQMRKEVEGGDRPG